MYNSVPTNDIELTEIQDVIDRGISYDEFNRFRITPFIIYQCIIQLKTGKHDGSEGFNSNHLINGGHRLYVLLSLLFNCMIVHGHTPKDLLASTIISIPKDMRASLCKSDNYRGISLFNAICKVFDYVIMYLCDEFLYTSEMPFGFKQNHSTVLCSLMYKEVASNYLQNGSNVYSCLLDASKAFDRIHFGKLFAILIERNVPLCFIRLILDAYSRVME